MRQTSNPIFICYRRDDSADITGRFYDRLVARFGKEAIFKDVDSIPLGVDFRTHVDQTIRNCSVVLVIIGERWLDARDESGMRRLELERDHVRIEIQSALAREVPIVPVIVGKAKHPSSEDLPESIQPLAFRNGASIRSDPHFHSDAGFVIDHLAALLLPQAPETKEKIDAAPVPSPPPLPSPSAPLETTPSPWWKSIPVWLALWIAAGGIAGSMADVMFASLFNRLSADQTPMAPWYCSAVPVFLGGMLLGLFQWLVLRLHLQRIRWWIPITALALLVGDLIGNKAALHFQSPTINQSYVVPAMRDQTQLFLVSTQQPTAGETVEVPAAPEETELGEVDVVRSVTLHCQDPVSEPAPAAPAEPAEAAPAEAAPAEPAPAEAAPAEPAATEALPAPDLETLAGDEEANRRRNSYSSLAYAVCIGFILGMSQHLVLRQSSLPLEGWFPLVLFSQVVLALTYCPAAMDWSSEAFNRSFAVSAFHGFVSGSLAAFATAIPLGIAVIRKGRPKTLASDEAVSMRQGI